MQNSSGSRMDELCDACSQGNVERMSQLFDLDLDVNGTNRYGRTPLQVTKTSCHHIVQELLERGADPDVPDVGENLERSTYRTITHDVCSHGFLRTLQVLAAYGANLSAVDKYGNCPAHYAARKSNIAILRYISKGVFLSRQINGEGKSPLDIIEETGDIDDSDCSWVSSERRYPKKLERLCVIRLRQLIGRRLQQLRTDNVLPTEIAQQLIWLGAAEAD